MPILSGTRFSHRARMFAAGLVSTLAIASGCSSDPEPKSDEVTYAASAVAKSELGIDHWRTRSVETERAAIEGIASDGRVVLKLESIMRVEGDLRRVLMKYTRGDETATVNVASAPDTKTTLEAETAAEDETHPFPRGFNLLMQDLAAFGVQKTTSGLAVASLGSVAPLDTSPGEGPGHDVPLPDLTTNECPWLTRCGGLNQLVNCVSSTYDLSNCSLKGLIAPFEKEVKKRLTEIFERGDSVSSVFDCPTNVDSFFRSCTGYNGHGTAVIAGNGGCTEGKQCASDPEATAPCPNKEHTECHGGCAGNDQACINSYGDPCASDAERSKWCCTATWHGNTCGADTCGKEGAENRASCCAGLVWTSGHICQKSCVGASGACTADSQCCLGTTCRNGGNPTKTCLP